MSTQNDLSNQPASRRSRAGRIAVVIAGAALLAFVAALVVPLCDQTAAGSPPKPLVTAQRYFRLRQWQADARTLLAVARYVLQPVEPAGSPPPTNRYETLLVDTNRGVATGAS